MEKQEEKKAQPLSQVQAEQPESQAKPPQQPHWYIVVVNYRHENRCADNLSRLGYETYVAAQKEKHLWRNRQVKWVDRIIFPNLVFVRLMPNEVKNVQNLSFVNYMMQDKALRLNRKGWHPLAVIPDFQMEQMRKMLAKAPSPVELEQAVLKQGVKVRVIAGELFGLVGEVERNHAASATRIYVSLGVLGQVTTSIERSALEVVNE